MAEQVKIELVVVDKTSAALGKTQKNVVKLNNSLVGTGKLARLAGAALAAIGLARIGKFILNTASQFQDLRVALSSVTGSIEKGEKAFNFILDFAKTSIFEVGDLTNTFIKLRGAGIEPTKKLLMTFQDVASVSADRLGTLQAITDLFARTTAGGLGLEELNRLGDRGIPVFKMLENTLGLSRLEISKVGQTAEGARLILDALQFSIEKNFGGASARLTNNYSQAVSNLNDAFSSFADEVGKGFLPQLTKIIKETSGAVGTFEDMGRVAGRKLAVALALGAEGLKIFAENLLLVLGFGGAILFVKLAAATVRAAGAMFLLGKAVIAGVLGPFKKGGAVLKKFLPFLGKLTAGVALVGGGFAFVKETMEAFDKKAAEIEATLNADAAATKAFEEKIEAMKNEIEDADGAIQKFRVRLRQLGGEVFQAQLIARFDELDKKIQLSTGSIDIMEDAFMGLSKGIGDAFAGAIVDAKNFNEAMSNLARTIIKQVIASIVTLGIQILILDKLRPVFEKMRDAIFKQKQAQDSLNSSLRTEIGLRAILALFGGGGGGGIPFLADGGSLQRGQPAIVGEEGPELFVPNQSGKVIPNNMMPQADSSSGSAMGGDVNVNFNINTVDASDFDELLVDRRTTIVGIINSALNQRGKVGVTN